MASFTYVALDRSGKRTTGSVPADSRAAAMDAVIGQGLAPVTITEEANPNAPAVSRKVSLFTAKKVSARSVEAFTRELANLLGAGLSLSRALALLKREASQPIAKETWTKIHDDVVGGESLGDAMAKFPSAFSQVYIAMVRAGEAGGFLHVVLQQIADFRQREQELTGRVKAAMIYPIALATVATGVVIFLLTFFIPKFEDIFKQLGSNLPILTQVVVAISNWLLSYGIYIAIALIIGIFYLRRWLRTDSGRRAMERIVLMTPALGTVIARFSLVRFSRMLGTLVGAGVPLVASLKVAKEAIGNQTLQDAVATAIEQVQRGIPLSRALAGNVRLFPPSVIEMIAVAEETGRLDKELLRMSQTYESELDRNLRSLVALAEPVLLIIMAGMIGTIVVSMLLPIFNLQDMIK